MTINEKRDLIYIARDIFLEYLRNGLTPVFKETILSVKDGWDILEDKKVSTKK